jgi:tetratricopeptide (TPR) repeat protein
LLKNKLTEFEAKVGQISKTNEEQDRRLKLLELIEKVSSLVRNGHYDWALSHISIGLDSDPENPHLLSLQASCHGKMGRTNEFININKKLLDMEKCDIPKSTIAVNLLEGYAITNQVEEFNSLYTQYNEYVVNYAKNGALEIYLKTLLLVSSGKVKDAIEVLKLYIKQLDNTQPYKHLGEWGFDEVRVYTNKIQDENGKNLMLNTIRYFNGEFNSETFVGLLK